MKTRTFSTFCATLLLSFIILPQAYAGYIFAENPSAHYGTCMQPVQENPLVILSRNGIKLLGSYSNPEILAVAKGIQQVEQINGGPLPKSWSANFNFLNIAGPWNQQLIRYHGDRTDSINVHKYSYGGDNVAALMHEFGHKIANADGQKFYRQYLSLVRPCAISPYAVRGGRAEELAEAFSALITGPDTLKAKCPSAYSFFTTVGFRDGGQANLSSCSARRKVPGT